MEKPEEPSRPPFYQRKEFPPLAVFGGFVAILLLTTAFSGRPPSIDRVAQEDNLAAEIVTITGRNFGAPGTGGEVRIGDLALTAANYLKWSEEEIVASIPREISSGIIYVVTKNGKCRGDIYMNPDEIPRLTSYSGPLIESLSAVNVAPGRVLVFKGERFGAERGTSRVSFTQIVPAGGRGDERERDEQLVSATDADGDYLAWSDREIRVRVPDGAKTGPVMVVTDKGQSNYKYVTVISPVGRRGYGGRASYRLRIGASVAVKGAAAPNSLRLLVPRPVDCSEQRKVRASGEPFPGAPGGPLEITLADLAGDREERVAAEYTLDRYAVETEIDPALVVADDRASPFYLAFTGDDPSVAPSHPALALLLRAATGGEKNPYLAARKIYDFVIDRLAPEDTPEETGAAAVPPDWYALAGAKTGDARAYAALFASLVRRAGIPARLVAGYYVDGGRTARPHYWSEFYLEDFGWAPVDPFLGEGSPGGGSGGGLVTASGDARNYYFGNLDNRHLAFAKGYRSLAKADPQARTASKPEAVGLQPFCEEASPGLKNYSSSWDRLTVLEAKYTP